MKIQTIWRMNSKGMSLNRGGFQGLPEKGAFVLRLEGWVGGATLQKKWGKEQGTNKQSLWKRSCEALALRDDLHRLMEFDNYSWLSGGGCHGNSDFLDRVYKWRPNEDSAVGIGSRKINKKEISMEKRWGSIVTNTRRLWVFRRWTKEYI